MNDIFTIVFPYLELDECKALSQTCKQLHKMYPRYCNVGVIRQYINYAAKIGRLDMLATIKKKVNYGDALVFAAQNGHLKVVKYLVRLAPQAVGRATYYAVKCNKIGIAEYLLNCPAADVSWCNYKAWRHVLANDVPIRTLFDQKKISN